MNETARLRQVLATREIDCVGKPAVILPIDKVGIFTNQAGQVLLCMSLEDVIEWLQGIDLPANEPDKTSNAVPK